MSNENGNQDKVGYVTVSLDDEEIRTLRNAQAAWDSAVHADDDSIDTGWRYASNLSPDQYIVLDWGKLVDVDLLECDSLPGELAWGGKFRITQNGRDALKAIDGESRKKDVAAAVDDAYAKGRTDAEREMQQQLYALFGDDCNWHEASRVPPPLASLKTIQYALNVFKTRTRNAEQALETRDKVDEWAAHLLDWAADTRVANHGERRGHMTMIAALLRFYVGSRNVQPVLPDPSSIPF